MATAGDISARLGLDTNSFKTDIVEAKNQFRKFGEDIQNEGKKAGAKAGEGTADGLGNALEHKLFGSRHIAGALATALGLNIEKIADKITAVIVGGTKEGFEQAIKLEERYAAALDARDQKRKTTVQLISNAEKDILNLQKEQAAIQGDLINAPGVHARGYTPSASQQTARAPLTQEQEHKSRELTVQIQEKQNALTDLKTGKEEAANKESERGNAYLRERLTDEKKVVDLQLEQVGIQDELKQKGLTQREIDERRNRLAANGKEIQDINLKITNATAAKNKEIWDGQAANAAKVRTFNEEQSNEADRLRMMLEDVLDIKKQMAQYDSRSVEYARLSTELTDKSLSLSKERESYRKSQIKESGKETKDEDANKLTLEELSNLDVFQTGVSSDVGRQGGQAREALRLKKQSEDARKLGNTDEAEDLRSKSDTIRSGLSALKSTERPIKDDLTQALTPTNQLLGQIDKTLSGKFKSQ